MNLVLPRKKFGMIALAGAMESRSIEASTEPMADSAINDLELFRELARGKEPAFSALYHRYQGALYRFVLHMTGSGAAAEDVTQEVFMQLITNPKNYDPSKGSVAGYLFGIARNLTRRDMNKSRHQVPLEDDHLVDGEELAEYGDLLEALSQSELVDWLRKAILTLPDQYREVVVLCDLEELSYPEAGDILRCSAGTVGSRLHRARTMLRAKLKCQGCLP